MTYYETVFFMWTESVLALSISLQYSHSITCCSSSSAVLGITSRRILDVS